MVKKRNPLKVGDRVVVTQNRHVDSETAILRKHAGGNLWYVEFGSAKGIQFLRVVRNKVNKRMKRVNSG